MKQYSLSGDVYSFANIFLSAYLTGVHTDKRAFGIVILASSIYKINIYIRFIDANLRKSVNFMTLN